MNSQIIAVRFIKDEKGKPWGMVLKDDNGCGRYHVYLLKDAKEEHFEEILPSKKNEIC